MAFRCKAGNTLRLADDGGEHLKVVMTDPDEHGLVVLLSFTKVKPYKEQIVTYTQANDKKLFKQGITTTISYEHGIIANSKQLIQGVTKHPKREGPSVGKEMLEEIISGSRKSSRIPPNVFVQLRKAYPHLFK